MAVVVPLLISAAAGAAGLTATMATIATVAGGLVAAKSGLSKRIDDAAGKVFGKDLVKVGNIAGMFLAPSANAWGAENWGSMAGTATSVGAAAGNAALAESAVAGGGYVGASSATPALAATAPSALDAAVASAGDASGAMARQAIGSSSPLSYTPAGPSSYGAIQASQGVAPGGGLMDKVGSAWDKAGAAFKGMSPQAQSAAIQAGGQIVSGAAQGYSTGRQMQDQERRRLEEEERIRQRYRSGSGLSFRQQPIGALAAVRQQAPTPTMYPPPALG